MKNKFLSIVCIVYSLIILYVLFFDKLKNFLAPQMQIYIKILLIPLFIIGIVLLFDKSNHYKFKFSDLILLLPIIMLILSNDGRLTSTLASNRAVNSNTKVIKENKSKKIEKEVVQEVDVIQEDNNEQKVEDYDFSNVYFDVIDDNYMDLSGYLFSAPKANYYEGKTIRVKGFALTDSDFLSDEYFSLGKYAITCCAADASFTGFVIKYDKNKIKDGTWYQVEGILKKGIDKEGYNIMYIDVVNIDEINQNNEEQYVYPCYSYDNGMCKELTKYNLAY